MQFRATIQVQVCNPDYGTIMAAWGDTQQAELAYTDCWILQHSMHMTLTIDWVRLHALFNSNLFTTQWIAQFTVEFEASVDHLLWGSIQALHTCTWAWHSKLSVSYGCTDMDRQTQCLYLKRMGHSLLWRCRTEEFGGKRTFQTLCNSSNLSLPSPPPFYARRGREGVRASGRCLGL